MSGVREDRPVLHSNYGGLRDIDRIVVRTRPIGARPLVLSNVMEI